MNILVHAIGTPLGQSILKSLKISTLDINIFVTDIYDDAAGLFMVPEKNRVKLPGVKSKEYHIEVSNFIQAHQIDFVFPTISLEHEYYENHAVFYLEIGVRIATMNKGVYELVNNKFDCFAYLSKAKVYVPKTFIANLSEDFFNELSTLAPPYLLKPIKGASGKDIFKLDSAEKVKAIVSVFPPNYFLIQEYLSAVEEYTVGVYRSAFSEFEDAMIIKRDLQFGLSYKGEVIEHEEIASYALKVCRVLGTTFSANVQLKMHEGQPCVFEVNPRLSSTTFIRAHYGFNEPEMIIKDCLSEGKDLMFLKRQGRFSRYWEEFFFQGGGL